MENGIGPVDVLQILERLGGCNVNGIGLRMRMDDKARHDKEEQTYAPEGEPNSLAYRPLLLFPASSQSAIVPRLRAWRTGGVVHRQPPTFLVESADFYAI
jgi:hypothetical protein